MDNQDVKTSVEADSEAVREFIYLTQDKPIKFFEEKAKELDDQIAFLKARQEKEYPSRSRAIEIETLDVERSWCMIQVQNHQLQAIMDKWRSEQEQEQE